MPNWLTLALFYLFHHANRRFHHLFLVSRRRHIRIPSSTTANMRPIYTRFGSFSIFFFGLGLQFRLPISFHRHICLRLPLLLPLLLPHRIDEPSTSWQSRQVVQRLRRQHLTAIIYGPIPTLLTPQTRNSFTSPCHRDPACSTLPRRAMVAK